MPPPVNPQLFDIGDRVRFDAVTRNIAGSLVDPTTLTVSVKDGSGTVSAKSWPADPEVVRSSTGTFYRDVDMTAAGYCVILAQAKGAAVAAEELWIRVRSPEVPRS